VVVQFRGLDAVPDPDSTLSAMDAKYVFMADPVRPTMSFFQGYANSNITFSNASNSDGNRYQDNVIILL
jgi:hypothetical protein